MAKQPTTEISGAIPISASRGSGSVSPLCTGYVMETALIQFSRQDLDEIFLCQNISYSFTRHTIRDGSCYPEPTLHGYISLMRKGLHL